MLLVQSIPADVIYYTANPVEASYVSSTTSSIALEAPQAPRLNEIAYGGCSCITHLKAMIPGFPRGDAENLETNSIFPVKNGAIKLSYRIADEKNVNRYHVAYIQSIEADGIHVSEQNFSKKPGCPVTYRIIDPEDPHIQGYYNPTL